MERVPVNSILSLLIVFFFVVLSSTASYAERPPSPRIIVTGNGDDWELVSANETTPSQGVAMFTPAFGPSTLTLPPIYEAVVRGGKVKSINIGGNSTIPKDGYVLASFDQSVFDFLVIGDSIEIKLRDGIEKGWSATHAIDGINTIRNTDNLVIFTPKSSGKSTGTNEYGIEAIVRNGLVEAVQGNNNPIPNDGFVISGHGEAQVWLQENIESGAKAEISEDRKTLTVSIDTASYIAEAKKVISKLAPGSVRADCEALISGSEASLKAGDVRQALESAFSVLDLGRPALYRSSPSAVEEYRGFWYRTAEASREEIRTTLDRLSEANTNILLLETFYDGRTIYPSALTEQHVLFDGWDPLSVWIEEAHRRHIQLHAWMHISNIGETGIGPILESHPEWAAVQRDGSIDSTHEPGLYFGDLANPGFQNYMSAMVHEALSKYDLDGIELDYIRYPSGEGDSAFSYSEYCRESFKSVHNVDPVTLTPKDKLWRVWGDWRREQISSFVRRIRNEVKRAKPGLLISAAVSADSNYARNTLMQDWIKWLDEGLLDFISPMLYSIDSSWVAQTAGRAAVRSKGTTAVVLGLGYFIGLTPVETAEQIMGLRNAGSQGSLLFSLGAARGGLLQILRSGLWSRPAEPPLGRIW